MRAQSRQAMVTPKEPVSLKSQYLNAQSGQDRGTLSGSTWGPRSDSRHATSSLAAIVGAVSATGSAPARIGKKDGGDRRLVILGARVEQTLRFGASKEQRESRWGL